LTRWLERIMENVGIFQAQALRKWTPKLIRKLNTISNKVSQAIDFWLNSILGGYITEFAIDCT
jgi:hypothetical protein